MSTKKPVVKAKVNLGQLELFLKKLKVRFLARGFSLY